MPKFPSQIPRTIPPKFHTASDQRSLRDADALPRQHIRHTTTNFQQSGNTNQIAELTRQIMRMRLRKQTDPDDPVEIPRYPFQIYPCDIPATGATNCLTFDPVTFEPISCVINSEVSTDFAANPPTINPDTDSWRFYALRGGYIQVRPYYTVISPGQQNNIFNYNKDCAHLFRFTNESNGDMSPTDGIDPNLQARESNQWDSPSGNRGNVLVIPSLNVNASDLDGDGNILFALWIEIVPDTSNTENIVAELRGGRWSLDPIGGLYIRNPFPSFSSSVIPIAIVKSKQSDFTSTSPAPYDLLVDQIQFGHIIDRYPSGMFNVTGGTPAAGVLIPGPMIQRGDWDMDDIKDQVFYPGDCIIATISSAVQLSATIDEGDSVDDRTTSIVTKRGIFTPKIITLTSDPATDPHFQMVCAFVTDIAPSV